MRAFPTVLKKLIDLTEDKDLKESLNTVMVDASFTAPEALWNIRGELVTVVLNNYLANGTGRKDEWFAKSDVTKEAIEAVRDYAVQKLVDKYYADSKDNPDCVHPSTMSFQWNRKDGAVVTLSVHVELPKTIPLDPPKKTPDGLTLY